MFVDFCLWIVDLGVIGIYVLEMIFGSVACLQRVRKESFVFFPEH